MVVIFEPLSFFFFAYCFCLSRNESADNSVMHPNTVLAVGYFVPIMRESGGGGGKEGGEMIH